MIIQLTQSDKFVWLNVHQIVNFEALSASDTPAGTSTGTSIQMASGGLFNVNEGPDEVSQKIAKVIPSPGFHA
jgi:uncharacterized protein YlzI (FlbEa/FlbD family)